MPCDTPLALSPRCHGSAKLAGGLLEEAGGILLAADGRLLQVGERQQEADDK